MTTHYLAPAAGGVLLFVSSAAAIVAMLRAPLRPIDYFLAGGIGTLLASLAVFLGFVRLSHLRDIFYKRRRREGGKRGSGPPSILGL